MISLFNRLTQTGITNELSFAEKRRIRILNRVIFLALIVKVIFLFSYATRQSPVWAAVQLIFIVSYISALYLNKSARYLFAKLLFTIVLSFDISINAIIIGPDAFTVYYLLGNFIFVFILFEKKIHFIFLSAFIFSCFILVKVAHQYIEPVLPLNTFYYFFDSTVMFGCIYLGMTFFTDQYRQYQSEIELKNLELQHQKLELEKLNQTKNKLFSIIGHDLRGPVGGLQSVVTLLKDNIITEDEFKSLTDQLKVSVDRVYEVQNNLLQWAHSQMEGISTKLTSVDLRKTVENIKELFSESLHTKKLLIQNNIDPALKVSADINQLNIILRNILSNAIKFSHPETIIECHAVVIDNDTVQISVRDHGVGIDVLEVQDILHPKFYKSRKGTNNEKGTGLGLIICKEFVENQGGKLWIDSEKGKGTTVNFTIKK
jgi:two-component system, sensor histidine kinase and response regulator